VVERHDLAWDCGAGSGQATLDLAARFARVVATDVSSAQIGAAAPHPRVEYRVAPAEASGLDDHSVDLVAVAQALHWFDLPRFFAEADRVLAPAGVLAAWSYGPCRVVGDGGAVTRFAELVRPCWPPERALVESGYRTIDFPFHEVPAPELEMSAEWTSEELLGYLGTWSAVTAYATSHGQDPIPALRAELTSGADPARRFRVVWPLALRAGRATG
jgi:ubiquinone/menaquinone biosynthesis C-methylase UbiE